MIAPTRLGELVSILGGGTPDRDRVDYYNGDIPWVTVKDLKDELTIRTSQERITRLGLENSASRLIPAGSVIVATRMAVGKAVRTLTDVAINQDLKAIVSGQRIDTGFLLFFLRSKASFLEARASGSTVKGILIEDLKELELALPSLPEQQQIAKQLEDADRLVRTRRYALQLIQAFLPAVFLKIFGDPTTNSFELPTAELGSYLSFVTSGSRGWAEHYAPNGARFIRSLDVRMNKIADQDAVYVVPPAGAEAERTRVVTGDVLLTITGSRIGRVAPVPERLAGAFISQHVAILRLKAGLLPGFLSMFLSLESGGQRQIARAQYGQTKPGLNLDQIRQLRVPVPDSSLQQKFLDLSRRVERLRAVQQEALRQAEHLFASLLNRAFNCS